MATAVVFILLSSATTITECRNGLFLTQPAAGHAQAELMDTLSHSSIITNITFLNVKFSLGTDVRLKKWSNETNGKIHIGFLSHDESQYKDVNEILKMLEIWILKKDFLMYLGQH